MLANKTIKPVPGDEALIFTKHLRIIYLSLLHAINKINSLNECVAYTYQTTLFTTSCLHDNIECGCAFKQMLRKPSLFYSMGQIH